MDLTKPIVFNSLSVNSLATQAGGLAASGYLVERFNPSQIDIAAFMDKKGQHDGLDASDVYLGGRRTSMIVGVYGSTVGDFWDKAQGLLAAFSPTIQLTADTANLGFLPMTFFQQTAITSTWSTASFPSGIPLQYYFRSAAPPSYDIERDKDGGRASKGNSKQFLIQLLARDPRKYLQTATTVSITTSTQTATYRGDYPTYPEVTFTLSAAGSATFTLTIGGSAIVLNLSAAAAGTYILDYATGRLYDAATGAFKMSLFSSITTFQPIKVGTTYVMSNATNISACSMTYREAFA